MKTLKKPKLFAIVVRNAGFTQAVKTFGHSGAGLTFDANKARQVTADKAEQVRQWIMLTWPTAKVDVVPVVRDMPALLQSMHGGVPS